MFFLLCVCACMFSLPQLFPSSKHQKLQNFLRKLTSQRSKNHEQNHLSPLNPDPQKMSAAISGGQRSRGGGCLGKVTPSKINSHWVFLWWEKSTEATRGGSQEPTNYKGFHMKGMCWKQNCRRGFYNQNLWYSYGLIFDVRNCLDILTPKF